MNLSETEKRILYQTDGYDKSAVTYELRAGLPFIKNQEQREAYVSLIKKLESLPSQECLALIHDIRKNYRIPGGPKTIGELLADARRKSGAECLKGHDIMALERFDPNVKHMIIFDVLSYDSFVGDKGDKMRLFLTETGYQKALENQDKGFIKIRNHAKVAGGNLHYEHKDREL